MRDKAARSQIASRHRRFRHVEGLRDLRLALDQRPTRSNTYHPGDGAPCALLLAGLDRCRPSRIGTDQAAVDKTPDNQHWRSTTRSRLCRRTCAMGDLRLLQRSKPQVGVPFVLEPGPTGWRYAQSMTAPARARPLGCVGSGRRNGCPGRTKKLSIRKWKRPEGHPLDKNPPIQGSLSLTRSRHQRARREPGVGSRRCRCGP